MTSTLAQRFQNSTSNRYAEMQGAGQEQTPYAQVRNDIGAIGIALDQEKLDELNFNTDLALKIGWRLDTRTVAGTEGPKEVPFIVTDSPRFSIVARTSIWGEYDNGEKYCHLDLYVIFLSEKAEPLHDGPCKLRLKSGSAFKGSFYHAFDNLKNPEGCWLKDVFDIAPRAKGELQALFVFAPILETKLVGKGQHKKNACRVTGYAGIDDESMFLGSFDDEPTDIETKILEARKDVLDILKSRRPKNESEEVTATNDGDTVNDDEEF